MSDAKLKPCPFCGGEAGSWYEETYSVDSSYDMTGCQNCSIGCNDIYRDPNALWNTRADLAPKVSVHDAAKVLLVAHAQASSVPPSDRTPVQDDLAQMGRKRLLRIASALVAHGEE